MKKAIFFLIILLALFLRTYKIESNPPSLSWDEVSIGYNAYSIVTTGRDEHGRFFPLDTFIAYGDYKPPLSIYITAPFVAVFGLNELAVRLPSALFGTLTVLMAYFLVKELFRKSPSTINFALLTSLLLAISPWHINISRAGFEANIALFLAVVGAWCFLSAREHPKRLLIAFIPFVLTMYTFNSSRIFSLVMVPALILFMIQLVRKHVRLLLAGFVIGLIIAAPILPHLFSKEASLRFKEVNIFSDVSIVETSNMRIEREKNTILSKIINNRRVGYIRSFIIHFMDNFQPEYLFVNGDGNPKFSIQDVGQLYIVEAIFLVIGVFALFKDHAPIAILLGIWLLSAILPAAFARETPHALRTLNSIPTWHIFIAYGLTTVVTYLKKWKLLCIVFISCLYLGNCIYYLHNYYRHYPVEYSAEWQYGYREALEKIDPVTTHYKTISIADVIGRPYMYTLFYTKTDPHILFTTKKSYFDAAGFYHVDGFSKYTFGQTLPDTLDPDTLYIWGGADAPKGARVIDRVELLNGYPVLVIFDSGNVNL